MQAEKIVLSETQLALLEQLNPGRWQRLEAHQRTITNLLEKGLNERDLDNDTIRITAAGTQAIRHHVLVGSSEYALLKKAQRKAPAAVETQAPKSSPGYGDDLPADLKEALKPAAAGIKSLIRPFGGGNGSIPAEAPKAKLEVIDEPDRDEEPVNEENGPVLDDPRPPIIVPPATDDEADEELEDWQVNIDLPIPFVLAKKPNGHPVDYVDDDCSDGDCAHAQVVGRLRALSPRLGDLIDVVILEQQIVRELGL